MQFNSVRNNHKILGSPSDRRRTEFTYRYTRSAKSRGRANPPTSRSWKWKRERQREFQQPPGLERATAPVEPVVVELTRSEEIQALPTMEQVQVTQMVPVQNGATIFMLPLRHKLAKDGYFNEATI